MRRSHRRAFRAGVRHGMRRSRRYGGHRRRRFGHRGGRVRSGFRM